MAKPDEYKITKITFQNQGFRDVLQSQGCQTEIYNSAKRISEEANGNNRRGGDGFAYRVEKGSKAKRYLGFVYATDTQANIAQSEDNALGRAVHE